MLLGKVLVLDHLRLALRVGQAAAVLEVPGLDADAVVVDLHAQAGGGVVVHDVLVVVAVRKVLVEDRARVHADGALRGAVVTPVGPPVVLLQRGVRVAGKRDDVVVLGQHVGDGLLVLKIVLVPGGMAHGHRPRQQRVRKHQRGHLLRVPVRETLVQPPQLLSGDALERLLAAAVDIRVVLRVDGDQRGAVHCCVVASINTVVGIG